jgi:hypothetical protein
MRSNHQTAGGLTTAEQFVAEGAYLYITGRRLQMHQHGRRVGLSAKNVIREATIVMLSFLFWTTINLPRSRDEDSELPYAKGY